MKGWCAPFLVIAAALLPVVAADSELQAASMDAHGETAGQGVLEAMLRVGSVPPEAAFQLHAADLHVEVDVADPVVNTGLTRPSLNPWMEPSDYKDARVTGTAVREGFRWLILPPDGERPSTTIASSCLKTGTPGPTGPWTPKARLERGSLEPDTSDKLAVTEACTGQVTLRGDFTLVLWEWDATVNAQGEETQLWSGARPSSKDPAGTPESGQVIQEFREVYLYVSNGVLHVPLNEQDVLYLDGVRLGLDGGATLRQATGSLKVGTERVEVEDAWLDVEGDLDVTVARGLEKLAVQLGGTIRQVRVDGQEVAGVAAGPSPSTQQPLVIVASAVTALLLALAAMYVWYPRRAYRKSVRTDGMPWITRPSSGSEWRALGWVARANDALKKERLDAAVRLSSLAVWVNPNVPEGRWAKAMALARKHEWLPALREHRILDGLFPVGGTRAHNALKAAAACRHLGLQEERAHWLAMAAREDPDLYKEKLQGRRPDAVRSPTGTPPVQHGPDVA